MNKYLRAGGLGKKTEYKHFVKYLTIKRNSYWYIIRFCYIFFIVYCL